jgi:hypothetical protein
MRLGSALRATIGSLSVGLLLSFSGLMTSGCASGDKDKGDDMASDDDKPKKKKKKKKKKPAANKDSSSGDSSGGDK